MANKPAPKGEGKKDQAYDRKHGIKEDSKKDVAQDKKKK